MAERSDFAEIAEHPTEEEIEKIKEEYDETLAYIRDFSHAYEGKSEDEYVDAPFGYRDYQAMLGYAERYREILARYVFL